MTGRERPACVRPFGRFTTTKAGRLPAITASTSRKGRPQSTDTPPQQAMALPRSDPDRDEPTARLAPERRCRPPPSEGRQLCFATFRAALTSENAAYGGFHRSHAKKNRYQIRVRPLLGVLSAPLLTSGFSNTNQPHLVLEWPSADAIALATCIERHGAVYDALPVALELAREATAALEAAEQAERARQRGAEQALQAALEVLAEGALGIL